MLLHIKKQHCTMCQKIFENKIHVSLFIDPDETQIRASVMDGVDMIEINTTAYAEGERNALERIKKAAVLSKELGLEVAAGHGLTHHNLDILVKMFQKSSNTTSDMPLLHVRFLLDFPKPFETSRLLFPNNFLLVCDQRKHIIFLI